MTTKKTSLNPLPKHIAIIMDGNRRFAKKKGLPEIMGHKFGAEALERVIRSAAKMGIKTLTAYALSTENLTERTPEEISSLFSLLTNIFLEKSEEIAKQGIRVEVLGETKGLPPDILKIIEKIHTLPLKKEVMHVNVCLNYGGRAEILRAVKSIIKDGLKEADITPEVFANHLFTKKQVDPDLMIRTGGRNRLSNYLLWQTSYAEVYFTSTLWPDFDGEKLQEAIMWFQDQPRNFGK